jgi:hypothetical protein
MIKIGEEEQERRDALNTMMACVSLADLIVCSDATFLRSTRLGELAQAMQSLNSRLTETKYDAALSSAKTRLTSLRSKFGILASLSSRYSSSSSSSASASIMDSFLKPKRLMS